MKYSKILLTGLASSASAYLATTTRYFDGQEGACGCGNTSGNFGWQLGIASGVYTAAGSQALFDTAGGTWCGAGCGKCYQLTSTGSAPPGSNSLGGTPGASIIVMVTNLCPNNGNGVWCPNVGGTNQYGYSYHFDINAQNEIIGDNPVVNFEPVLCPGQAITDWEQCVCYGNVALATDVTPVGLTTAGSVSPASSTTSSAKTSSKVSTSKASSKTSTTSKTPTTSSSGATQTLYGQCGGINWTGPTACGSGAVCTVLNSYYYQCLP